MCIFINISTYLFEFLNLVFDVSFFGVYSASEFHRDCRQSWKANNVTCVRICLRLPVNSMSVALSYDVELRLHNTHSIHIAFISTKSSLELLPDLMMGTDVTFSTLSFPPGHPGHLVACGGCLRNEHMPKCNITKNPNPPCASLIKHLSKTSAWVECGVSQVMCVT